jgi:hypothetical protein
MRASLIQEAATFGALDTFHPGETRRHVRRALKQVSRRSRDLRVPLPPPMLSSEPERVAEAIRITLPELLKLDRYERSTVARRDNAARPLVARKVGVPNH